MAGLLVLEGCSNARYSTTVAPAERGYIAPNVALNALYGGSYEAPYDVAPKPMYGEGYAVPYDVVPNGQNCTITNKHPSGASC